MSVERSTLKGMTAGVEGSPEAGCDADAVLDHLTEVLTAMSGLVHGGGSVDDAVRIDRITILEQIKGAVGAVRPRRR